MQPPALFPVLLIALAAPGAEPASSLPVGTPGDAGERDLPALEPVIASAARWAVAILVDREEEPPLLPEVRPGSGLPALPRDLVEYRRRPPGPATGMLIDSGGHVLTSSYNVEGKVKGIEVVFPGGERRSARILATDKSDDLALLRMDGPPAGLEVPEVKWGEPGRLKVGSMVVALGRAPDPARPTATFGIISALGRNGGRAFQTDAELNYGNAGGPIADLDGSIVGLAGFVGHSRPYSLWGLNSGIGFGTTAETIRAVLPRLLRGENVPPPQFPLLGVGPSTGPSPDGQGALLGEVSRDSAAARAGLRVDDVILLFDGEKVESFLDLRRQIQRRKPGDEVVLKVRRGTEELSLQVKLGKRGD